MKWPILMAVAMWVTLMVMLLPHMENRKKTLHRRDELSRFIPPECKDAVSFLQKPQLRLLMGAICKRAVQTGGHGYVFHCREGETKILTMRGPLTFPRFLAELRTCKDRGNDHLAWCTALGLPSNCAGEVPCPQDLPPADQGTQAPVDRINTRRPRVYAGLKKQTYQHYWQNGRFADIELSNLIPNLKDDSRIIVASNPIHAHRTGKVVMIGVKTTILNV